MTGTATAKQLLKEGAALLASAGVPDAALDSGYLLAEVLKVPRLNLLFSPSLPVPGEAAEKYRSLIRRRADREPLQYILGTQPFYGRDFLVGEGVLIPRQDTESVCERALSLIPEGRALRVLDLCCGSGALAVTLALERPLAQVTASDISEAALSYARKNILGNSARVTLVQGDLWEAVGDRVFDVVVSNPPYIPDGEMPLLQAEVRREPEAALRGGEDGLSFYRRILAGLPGHLSPGGGLCLECGDGQTGALMDAVRPLFDSACAFSDLGGRPRGVMGRGFRP